MRCELYMNSDFKQSALPLALSLRGASLAPREREPDELSRAIHAPSPRLCGERVGVRGLFSHALNAVPQFHAGGLAEISRWWRERSDREPPDFVMRDSPMIKVASRRDARTGRSRPAVPFGCAHASCVPPGRDLEGGSIVCHGSGGSRSRSLASPPADFRQASGLPGVLVSHHGMSCSSTDSL
jgi:hypothetical protein